MLHKKHGFPGEISVVIPPQILNWAKKNPLINSLYITDIGFFPNALYHFRERPDGCPQHILLYNMEGKGEIEIQGQHFIIEPNQFFVIPANTPHQYRADSKMPWTIYWLHFEGEKSKYFSRHFGKINAIEPSDISRIDERLDLFSEILFSLEMGYSNENIEYINLCLWHLLASFMYVNQFRQMKVRLKDNFVSKIIHYMQKNIDKPLKLSDLADYSGFSASHFSKLFYEQTGQSPMNYFNQLKIQKACHYLDFTRLSISDIAINMGFEDQFYFSRLFKKVLGVSPRQYRNGMKA